MPLLRRQAFEKQEPPPGLKDSDEVFVCKTTGEMFQDYEEFFERTILCNSLVWTCELTGKSGLTFQEAIDSEEKAGKQLATISDALQKPILFLATLTHRSRLSDLNDDIYSYVKEHYFIGETIEVVQHSEKKKCRVVKVISPSSQKNGKSESVASTSDDDSVICLDDLPKPVPKPQILPKPSVPVSADQFEYVVQEAKKNNIYIIKSATISRKWGSFTRDKSKMFLKQHCASTTSGTWRVKERYLKKYKMADVHFHDFFDGTPPTFTITASRKKKTTNGPQVIDLTDEDKAIKRAKRELKERKKREKERRKMQKENIKQKMKQTATSQVRKPAVVEVNNEPDFEKLSLEEKIRLREQIKADKLAARIAQNEELKKKREEEKLKRKEERDKEREKLKEEKIQLAAHMKEWNRPRDDLECDDLKDLPMATAVQTHIPTEMFGDAVMILEHLHCFRSLFDLNELFPNGISIGELTRAIRSSEVNGLFFDLVKLLLGTLFQLQVDEEDEDDGGDNCNMTIKDIPLVEEDKSFKELVKNATIASQWPQLYYSMSLKELPVDSFTVTEVLRLHFLASGAKGSDNNNRFRYQQRGAYTDHDDAGLEFRRQEVNIIKDLAEKNVFDLEPGDKLKLLTALVHQILTFSASRDLLEDNLDQFKQVSYDLRHHRWAETRRDKEEAGFLYKKRIEDRARERELERQRKEEKNKARIEKLAQEESGSVTDLTKLDDAAPTPKESPTDGTMERHSARQKEKVDTQHDAEYFDMPVENIQWDKISPEDRVRMKDKYTAKEAELWDQVNELQHGFSVCPLGRDRTFRRYWIFRSIPGLFVEDEEQHVPGDFFTPVTQTKGVSPVGGDSLVEDSPAKGGEDNTICVEEKSMSSDKENESFDQSKNSEMLQAALISADKNTIIPLAQNGINADVVMEKSQLLLEDIKKSNVSVCEQIENRDTVRWAFYDTQQLETLINSLNPRGYREGALKTALLEQKAFLCDNIKNISLEDLRISDADKTNKQVKYQNVKSRKKITQGAVQNASAQEFLELNLREMLLDIEERIYVGSLGSIKVKKRDRWRDAIEQGTYNPQCEEVAYLTDKSALVNGDVAAVENAVPIVHDLAKALLQIQQGIDSKYLTKPLVKSEEVSKQKQKNKRPEKKSKKQDGDDSSSESEDDESEKAPQKSALERWQHSLMLSTSLPQLLLHLSILESSITWSKSALHARCRICRRKGDAEKMLLCDGCDRGHHMYCLKPVVKAIPRGDWYCHDCRPKDIPKTPRKRRKSIFEEEEVENVDSDSSDDKQGSDSSDDDDSDSDDDSSSDDSDDDSSDNTEEDTEEEEVETPKVTKIKFINASRKKKVTPADKGRSGRSADRSHPNSRTPSQEREPPRAKPRGGKRSLEVEPDTKKRSRRSLPEPANKVKPAAASSSRRSLDSAKAGVKRKRESTGEDLPEAKKVLVTKSRGSERVMVAKMCEDLVLEIYERKEAWPFLTPVSRRDAPDYFSVVKVPMDLLTIKNKIKRYEYIHPTAILEDVRLVFRNCQQYNMPTAAEYIAGQKLSKYFEKQVRDLKLNTLAEQVKSPKKAAANQAETSPTSKRATRHK